MLITQKPHRKCPLSLTEEVHIPSYTDKRRSTKTFRGGQRREDYHNLLVCIPCKLSVCPFPSLFLFLLLLHPFSLTLHCSLVSSCLKSGLKQQKWWELALQPKPDSCVLPAFLWSSLSLVGCCWGNQTMAGETRCHCADRPLFMLCHC